MRSLRNSCSESITKAAKVGTLLLASLSDFSFNNREAHCQEPAPNGAPFSSITSLTPKTRELQKQKFSTSTKLLLGGGGDLPDSVYRELYKWSSESYESRKPLAEVVASEPSKYSPKLLVIAWGSAMPDFYFKKLEARLDAMKGIDLSPISAPPKSEMLKMDSNAIRSFVRLIDSVDSIMVLGGDQGKIMEVVAKAPEIGQALIEFHQSGRAITGTSAGTAVLPKLMTNGYLDTLSNADYPSTENDPNYGRVERGLGICPDGIMVDQHGWSPSKMENRVLRGKLTARRYYQPLCIVPAEGAAATLVMNNTTGVISVSALGEKVALHIFNPKNGEHNEVILSNGQERRIDQYLQLAEKD